MDWNKLKAEYIAGGTSYRKLAEKYGVSFAILRREAERGKWTQLRTQVSQEADTKMVDAVSSELVSHMQKINFVADKLLEKISMTLDDTDVLSSQEIKHYTSALKDIKDIKGIRSELDFEEQKARIEKLRKDVEDDKQVDDKVYGVLLMPPIMENLTPPKEEDDE